MVPGERIELPTRSSSGSCSTTELPRHKHIIIVRFDESLVNGKVAVFFDNVVFLIMLFFHVKNFINKELEI
jgi:hypothetical protein